MLYNGACFFLAGVAMVVVVVMMVVMFSLVLLQSCCTVKRVSSWVTLLRWW